MWPDCSPPSDRPRLSISSITYLSPTAHAHQLDAERLQRELEADVAHHGRDDRVALQPAFALQLPAAHQQHGVAVDDLRRGDRRRSRDRRRRRTRRPCWQPLLDDRPRQQLGMRRSAVQVDVAAVGLIADDDRSRSPRLLNSSGATVVVAPFAQSIAELEAAERRRFGNDRAQVIEIGADEIGVRHRRRRRRPRASHDVSATIASTSRSTRSVNFSPLPGEHLDAVVLERIVRRGDHDAGVVAAGARQVGDRRRRHDAGARHRRALAATRRARARPRSTSPDSRVSRPTRKLRRTPCARRGSARTSAAPSRRTVGGSSG